MDETSKSFLPEPWLRNTHNDLPAVIRGVIHALELADEDVSRWWALLKEDELNARPYTLASVGFHMLHLVRSLDRLLTYAEGDVLSDEQLRLLKAESVKASKAEVLAEFSSRLRAAKTRVLSFIGSDFEEKRTVGRKQLPTTVGGLLVHIADHTQRHTGEIIITAKLVIGMRNSRI